MMGSCFSFATVRMKKIAKTHQNCKNTKADLNFPYVELITSTIKELTWAKNEEAIQLWFRVTQTTVDLQ